MTDAAAEIKNLLNQPLKFGGGGSSASGSNPTGTWMTVQKMKEAEEKQKLEKDTRQELLKEGINTTGLVNGVAQEKLAKENQKRTTDAFKDRKNMLRVKRAAGTTGEQAVKAAIDYKHSQDQRNADRQGGVEVKEKDMFDNLFEKLQEGVEEGQVSEKQAGGLGKVLQTCQRMMGKLSKGQRNAFDSMISSQGLEKFISPQTTKKNKSRPVSELDLQAPPKETTSKAPATQPVAVAAVVETAKQKKNRKKREKQRAKKIAAANSGQDEQDKDKKI